MATIQQRLLKRDLKLYFWKVWWRNTDKTLLMTFEVGQGVSGINPQGFHASVWERGYFFVFFHFSNFEV